MGSFIFKLFRSLFPEITQVPVRRQRHTQETKWCHKPRVHDEKLHDVNNSSCLRRTDSGGVLSHWCKFVKRRFKRNESIHQRINTFKHLFSGISFPCFKSFTTYQPIVLEITAIQNPAYPKRKSAAHSVHILPEVLQEAQLRDGGDRTQVSHDIFILPQEVGSRILPEEFLILIFNEIPLKPFFQVKFL